MYAGSPVIKTLVSAALFYSDFQVSNLMLLTPLNITFSDNVTYISIGPIYSCKS
jgi:hypothetical protein